MTHNIKNQVLNIRRMFNDNPHSVFEMIHSFYIIFLHFHPNPSNMWKIQNLSPCCFVPHFLLITFCPPINFVLDRRVKLLLWTLSFWNIKITHLCFFLHLCINIGIQHTYSKHDFHKLFLVLIFLFWISFSIFN